jgi:hypothetical protein
VVELKALLRGHRTWGPALVRAARSKLPRAAGPSAAGGVAGWSMMTNPPAQIALRVLSGAHTHGHRRCRDAKGISRWQA